MTSAGPRLLLVINASCAMNPSRGCIKWMEPFLKIIRAEATYLFHRRQYENLITPRSFEDQPAGTRAVMAAHEMGPLAAAMNSAGQDPVPATAPAKQRDPAPDASACSLTSAGASTSAMPTTPPKTSASAADAPATSRRPEISCRRQHRLRRCRLATPRSAPRLGRRAALPERSRVCSKGFYPLGRNYPETSVGWYRRVFELTAEDAGKRITSSLTALIAKPWSSSMASILASTAAATIPSASTYRISPSRVAATCSWCGSMPPERRLVLRGCRHLPARVAGQDSPGPRQEMGHARFAPRSAPEKRTYDAALKCQPRHSGQNVRVVSTILDPSGKPRSQGRLGRRHHQCR